VKELAEQDDPAPDKHYLPLVGRNITITKPTIAAVNGLAYGAGFLTVQMCDLCVAADTATFAIPEAKIGRGAPWAAPLPWLIPPRVALEVLMTGEPMSAQRAYEIGFVNRVVRRAELEQAARELAQRIATNAPLTVKSAKAAVYASNWQLDSMYDSSDAIWAAVYRSPDAIEGPRAFRERRAPRWSEQ
jgi:enoyl-CoA hydratase/carnithine racemase